MKKLLPLLLILSIFVCEIIMSLSAVLGFVLSSLIVIVILIFVSLSKLNEKFWRLPLVLLVLPIIRMAGLFITFDFFWKALIIHYFLLFLVVFYSVKFKIDYGYTKKMIWLLPLALILAGILGFFGGKLFNFPKDFLVISAIPIISYSEEILFRGLIQNLSRENYSFIFSVIAPSLLYCVFSLGYGVLPAFFLFFISLIISLIYGFTKNMFLAIAMNVVISLFLFVF